MTTKKKYFQIKKKTDKKGEILIYGDIVSEEWFTNDITKHLDLSNN